MNRTAVTTGLVAALLVLAGCTGGTPGVATAPATDGTNTVDVYVSDERNDIDDFEHLNATVTSVSFHRVNDSGDGGEAEASDAEDGEWVTYDIDDATVDLTELRGAKASRIASLDVPEGNYTRVRVEVSGVEGTLKSGEDTRVKLPSGRLKLNEGFTVGEGEGEPLDFVFDITVIKAGNSGKYILKPVASESGTDVPIERVGGETDDVDDENDDDATDDEESEKSEDGNDDSGDTTTTTAAASG